MKAITTIKRYQFTEQGIIEIPKNDEVTEEKLIIIQIEQVGSFSLLGTPIAVKELAIGFAYTEGFIESIDDVIEISNIVFESNTIGMRIENPSPSISKRNLIVSSSCGFCGKRNMEKLFSTIVPCQETLKFSIHRLKILIDEIKEKQTLFQKTGGTHAAAIFDGKGKILAFYEDIGRHNALDKAIGSCLLNHINMKGCGVFLSSRISLEMVVKAARAGIEMIIAISSPTALAIQAAEYCHITLCGFVRDGNGNIYTMRNRLAK